LNNYPTPPSSPELGTVPGEGRIEEGWGMNYSTLSVNIGGHMSSDSIFSSLTRQAG